MVNNRLISEGAEVSATAVVCPRCQRQQVAGLVQVIRPDDEHLPRLFQGELNRLSCAECGADFMVPAPMLFRDDDERFLIYCLPLAEQAQWQDAERKMNELTAAIFADSELEEPPECRLTLTRRRFLEKIAIHLHGLDDRLIEYIKYQLYSRRDEPIDPVRSELFYDFSPGDSSTLAFILFDRESGEAQAAAHIPRELYEELSAAFLTDGDLQQELEALFPGCYVSVERILK